LVPGQRDGDVLEVVLPGAVNHELFRGHNRPSLARWVGREQVFAWRRKGPPLRCERLRGLTLILALACLLPPAAAAAVRGPGGSAKASFRVVIPKVGAVTVAQVKLTAKKKPKLVVSNKPELRGTATIVAAVVKSGKAWTARIVIANRGAKSASRADEDLGFAAINATVPGLGNRGVTGSTPTSFINVTPVGSHS